MLHSDDDEAAMSASTNATILLAYETDCSDVELKFSTADTIVAGVLASVCSVLGVAFNLCTVVALLHFPKTRQHVTTPFVVSLAAADGCFSLFTLPMLAAKFFARDWILGGEHGFACQVFPVLFYGNSAVTLFSLMCVTINRYGSRHLNVIGFD